ncbi:MAG: hypothetical protein K5905_12165 [Roseibium sp.]|uniref:hypothetical protein n=1 Tax=Roseibium sp. TaxID=1936156 RepID=UPI00260ED019|nr:hypothetical protein [Roseibium sp.]MCV0426222.1 hypothetical protein [Roseibium sp.]
MTYQNPRDKSRTSSGKKANLRDKYRSPPKYGVHETGKAWAWETEEFLSSPAYISLSINALRIYNRIKVEYLRQGRIGNGDLIVTHDDFRDFGASANLVADAIDELVFKGLVRVKRGKAADGTPHPNLFRITSLGTDEGEPWTNEWKGVTAEYVERWPEVRMKLRARRRSKTAKKKKSSLSEQRMSRSQNSESAVIVGGYEA